MPASTATQAPPRRDRSKASDRVLIERVARHDANAFEEIYRRHSGQALMLARKLCPARELAEEVVQESFISLWRSAHRYRPGLGSVSVWLGSIVRNRAIDAWRRAAVRPVEVPEVVDGPGQLHAAIGFDMPAPERAVVLSLIAELPAAQKEAVFLAYFGDMTHEQIATWAQAPLGTIKGRIRMGLQKIRARLEEESLAADAAAAPAAQATNAAPSAAPATSAASSAAPATSPLPVGRVTALDHVRRRRASLALRREQVAPAA